MFDPSGNYDVLNFNDMAMAFMVFMAMLVTGGVVTPVIQGLGLVSRGGKWCSIAFNFSFYYIGVLVGFNIFVSFIIDGLTSEDPDAAELPEVLMSFEKLLAENPEPGFKVIVRAHGGQVRLISSPHDAPTRPHAHTPTRPHATRRDSPSKILDIDVGISKLG